MTDSSIFNIGPHSIKQSPVKEYLPAYRELFIIAFNDVVIVQLVLLKTWRQSHWATTQVSVENNWFVGRNYSLVKCNVTFFQIAKWVDLVGAEQWSLTRKYISSKREGKGKHWFNRDDCLLLGLTRLRLSRRYECHK